MKSEPKTLQEAIIYFADADRCIDYLAVRRWPDGVICPTCGSRQVSFNAKRHTWKCSSHHAKREFSIKVGTIMEDSPIGLDKWLPAIWLLTSCKNGVSSYEISRALHVTQKTAWFMLHRIRLAMQSGSLMKIGGSGSPVEVDETFIGGKARFMHKDRKLRAQQGGRNSGGKAVVMGMLERDGDVRTMIFPSTYREQRLMHDAIRSNVSTGTTLMTDEFVNYRGLTPEYAHEVINHLEGYVNGQVHTNGIENFWSLLKRGLSGTYVAVEPFHLFRYVDEQVFRYNNRKSGNRNISDAQRFDAVLSQITGKRLTFAEVTGKTGTTLN
jgi:transposase-like protein